MRIIRWRHCRRPRDNSGETGDEHAHGVPARMGGARLLKRVFEIDLEHCSQCGGDVKIIAAIEEPAVIVRILTHLGLPARTHRAHRRGRWLSSRQPDSRGNNGSAATMTFLRGLRSCEAVKLRRALDLEWRF